MADTKMNETANSRAPFRIIPVSPGKKPMTPSSQFNNSARFGAPITSCDFSNKHQDAKIPAFEYAYDLRPASPTLLKRTDLTFNIEDSS